MSIENEFEKIKSLERLAVSETKGKLRFDDKKIARFFKNVERTPSESLYEEDNSYVVEVSKRFSNYQACGSHTQDVLGFIGRHLSQGLVEYVASKDGMQVWCVEGSVAEAWNFLKDQKFTQIELLHRAKHTDYNKFLAFRESDSRCVLVINGLSGKSPSIEALSNIFYSVCLQNSKKKVEDFLFFKSKKETKERFLSQLEGFQIQADLISFGYSESLERAILSDGGELLRYEKNEEIYFLEFLYKDKKILSLNVSPHFHGDRAAEFLDALVEYQGKKAPVIMLGTCGGISSDLELGQFVVPKLSKCDDETLENFSESKNKAMGLNLSLIQDMVQVDHLSIDAVLYEDSKWASDMKSHSSPLVVEKEAAYLFIKAKELSVPIWALLRVSDHLLKDGMDYNSSEHQLELTGGQMAELQLSLIAESMAFYDD